MKERIHENEAVMGILRNTVQWTKTLASHRWVFLAAVGLLATASVSIAENTEQTPAYLSQWLEPEMLEFSSTTIPAAPLRRFYTAQGYQPLWIGSRGLSRRGEEALEVLSKAGEEGINGERYHVQTIRSVAAMPFTNEEQAMRIRLSLETLMSHAVMRYAADMQGGAVRAQWNTGNAPMGEEQQAAVLKQAAQTGDVGRFLTGLIPTSRGYVALKQELKHYKTLAANGGWPEFPAGKQAIKPGAGDARLPVLRQILAVTGDLPAAEASNQTPTYDAATEAAVKRFQLRHGVEADGVIGKGTQEALAVPVSARIEQIALTMERMRWMPESLGSRYVLVNVPGYTLNAVSGGKSLAMNVIVGKPTNKTPMFSKEITDVVLNPTWSVPLKIAVNEMLPKLRNDPDYLRRSGFKVLQHTSGGTQEVDAASIDWNAVGGRGFNYAFRQNAGDGNALGKVKFNIPNSDSIYLHDTAQRGLFVKADRSLSHGCIRLGDPQALTRFVLEDDGWETAKIDAAYEASTSRTVKVTPMPVHLVYWTSWVDGEGRAHFRKDIYGMDKSLLAAMTLPGKAAVAVASR